MTETVSQDPSAVLFNPFEPAFLTDPYPHYRELREADPVQLHPMGFTVVTRHADVTTVLRAGLSVEQRNLGPGPLRDLNEQMIGDSTWRAVGVSMLDRDPPDHTRLRGLVSKVFTPRAIEALRPGIIALVDESLDRIAEEGSADLVDLLAFPLPFAVITAMLGMPPADHTRMRELTGMLVRSLEPINDQEVVDGIVAADTELAAIVSDAIAWKRANPADDLLTALIAAEHDGAVLDDEELIAQVILLYVAGHETTVNLIANGAVALLRDREQFDLLRSRPDLIGNAVEELLRYDSPVQLTRRITTEPFSVGGVDIEPGTFLTAVLGSANRDPLFWGPDADKLRLDRENARHQVSFGAGPHHCLGAALARIEGQVALGRLVDRFPTLDLAGDVVWNGRINLRGVSRLPVVV